MRSIAEPCSLVPCRHTDRERLPKKIAKGDQGRHHPTVGRSHRGLDKVLGSGLIASNAPLASKWKSKQRSHRVGRVSTHAFSSFLLYGFLYMLVLGGGCVYVRTRLAFRFFFLFPRVWQFVNYFHLIRIYHAHPSVPADIDMRSEDRKRNSVNETLSSKGRRADQLPS